MNRAPLRYRVCLGVGLTLFWTAVVTIVALHAAAYLSEVSAP